jgi:hypothetical protein
MRLVSDCWMRSGGLLRLHRFQRRSQQPSTNFPLVLPPKSSGSTFRWDSLLGRIKSTEAMHPSAQRAVDGFFSVIHPVTDGL